ncbi:MAG TPA: hypothetical protein VEQ60_12495, partial [Longimicrobium sp.]|nr:hypothetical protein [Longimicrobium sp.]
MANLAIAETRSFGRAQAVEQLQDPEARSLRKSILGHLKDQILEHALRRRGSGHAVAQQLPAWWLTGDLP